MPLDTKMKTNGTCPPLSWLSSVVLGLNTKPTQVRPLGKVNTGATRTERHSPVNGSTTAKTDCVGPWQAFMQVQRAGKPHRGRALGPGQAFCLPAGSWFESKRGSSTWGFVCSRPKLILKSSRSHCLPVDAAAAAERSWRHSPPCTRASAAVVPTAGSSCEPVLAGPRRPSPDDRSDIAVGTSGPPRPAHPMLSTCWNPRRSAW